MKQLIIVGLAVSGLYAAPVFADENATRIGCFQQVEVPATYSVKRVEIKKSHRKYIKRTNGRIDLMEYPAVYREDKTLVAKAHTVMREVKCSG